MKLPKMASPDELSARYGRSRKASTVDFDLDIFETKLKQRLKPSAISRLPHFIREEIRVHPGKKQLILDTLSQETPTLANAVRTEALSIVESFKEKEKKKEEEQQQDEEERAEEQ